MSTNFRSRGAAFGRSRRANRGPALVAVALAAGLLLPLGSGASAGHGPVAPGGPYSGFSHGTTLHLDALTVGTTRVANVDVGLASSVANTVGMPKLANEYDRLINPDALDKHAYSRSSIADLAVAANPAADAQLKPFEAVAVAPPPARVDKTAVDQTVSTVLDVSLARNVADSTWNDDTCVIGRPIATSEEHLARVDAVETADNPGTPPEGGFDAPVAALDANQGGVPRATTHTITREELYYPGSGDTFGLRSFVHSTLAPVTLFQGTTNEITIELDGPAFLDVRANGRAGGATVDFKAPIVTIFRGGSVLAQIPPLPAPLPAVPAVTIPSGTSGDVIAEVKVATLDPIATSRGGLGTATKNDAGTRAAAMANIVQVRILDLPSQNITGTVLALGHMEAAASVPEGGVTCPIPVTKTPDKAVVAANETFKTTITVTNKFDCKLDNVVLTDVIGVKDNAQFRYEGAVPTPVTTPRASDRRTGTVVWNLGSLNPGESRSMTLDLLALAGPGEINDTATATGTLVDCRAAPATGSVTASALAIPVRGVATARVPESAALPARLPRTGATNAAAAGAGIVLLAAGLRGLALRGRRRTS